MYSLGIIEGFYGKTWSHQERLGYAEFLATAGFSHYIYAPKADAHLRKDWRSPMPEGNISALKDLGEVYRAKSLQFGVGLSPYEIYIDYGPQEKEHLKQSISALNEADIDILAILYDDMRGDVPGLAQLQADIVTEAAAMSTAKRVLMCPTYYSYDPVLERVFGTMPKNYLSDLGRALDPAVEIFWTGRKVVSPDYSVQHLQEVAELLRRKPHMWDNYPVNDSERMSPFLHLKPVENRPAILTEYTSGWTANPMNQPFLSRLPLQSLRQSLLGKGPCAFEQIANDLCPTEIAEALAADWPTFHESGLNGIDEATKRSLIEKYNVWQGSPFADEVIAYLQGVYEFDPACLTD